ncbi:hypothetical protein [Paenibacillus sp. DMB5]|nr:hypothetical protein [Paenibacillus sp. DMB5]
MITITEKTAIIPTKEEVKKTELVTILAGLIKQYANQKSKGEK